MEAWHRSSASANNSFRTFVSSYSRRRSQTFPFTTLARNPPVGVPQNGGNHGSLCSHLFVVLRCFQLHTNASSSVLCASALHARIFAFSRYRCEFFTTERFKPTPYSVTRGARLSIEPPVPNSLVCRQYFISLPVCKYVILLTHFRLSLALNPSLRLSRMKVQLLLYAVPRSRALLSNRLQ